MTVVVDTTASGEVDLYADADRNLKIDDRDRVAAASAAGRSRRERIWRLPLDVALIENGAVRTVPRAVVFRLGASGQTLGYAVAGFSGGTRHARRARNEERETLEPVQTLAARRVDGDGNGLLADAARPPLDRFESRRALRPELRAVPLYLGAQPRRLAVCRPFRRAGKPPGVRAPAGHRHAPAGAAKGGEPSSPTEAVEMHATAISRDGSVFAVTGSEPATVPAGEYRLGTVTLALDDAKTGQRWSFVFSDGGAKGQPRWFKVDKDAAVTIDPIGTPSFELTLRDQTNAIRPGEDVAVQPALYTGDGLLIVVAYCGNPVSPAVQEILGARIALDDGRRQDAGHGPLGLLMRHVLPGLGPSARIATCWPGEYHARLRLRPAGRPITCDYGD